MIVGSVVLMIVVDRDDMNSVSSSFYSILIIWWCGRYLVGLGMVLVFELMWCGFFVFGCVMGCVSGCGNGFGSGCGSLGEWGRVAGRLCLGCC